MDWIRLRDSQPPRIWGEVGGVGVLVFLAGILAPIWKGIPYAFAVQDVVAFAGAGVAVLGFTLAWDARQARRADPARRHLTDDAEVKFRLGPGAEVYTPGRDSPREVEESDDDPEAPVDART